MLKQDKAKMGGIYLVNLPSDEVKNSFSRNESSG